MEATKTKQAKLPRKPKHPPKPKPTREEITNLSCSSISPCFSLHFYSIKIQIVYDCSSRKAKRNSFFSFLVFFQARERIMGSYQIQNPAALTGFFGFQYKQR
ncbi:hypothetical protein V6Z11_A11G227800 [Gossypium hirsutum]